MKYKEYIKLYFQPSHQEKSSFVNLLLDLGKWEKSLNSSPLQDEVPWITFDALRFLKKITHPNMKVFEYGSGGSSIFFAKRVKTVISVEHDEAWFQNVEQYAKNHNITNWEGYLILPTKLDNEIAQSFIDVDSYASSAIEYLNKYEFKNYASFIDKYEDGYFDIVFIDGRARPSCIKHGLRKVKKGGFLIVDNSDREYYFTESFKLYDFSKYRKIYDKFGSGPYGLNFWGTTIFQKESE